MVQGYLDQIKKNNKFGVVFVMYSPMKMTQSNDRDLESFPLQVCLKYRHSWVLMVILLFLTLSCGKVINAKKDVSAFNRDINFLLMENQCNDQSLTKNAKITASIKALFLATKLESPQSFANITPKFYSNDNPLVLSLDNFEKSYEALKLAPLPNQNGDELYYLYNGSQRYEDQKCSFPALSEKKKYDIRPFVNITSNCTRKFKSNTCLEKEYQEMSPEKEEWTKDNAIKLCNSFSNDINCRAEFNVNQRKNSIGDMVKFYTAKFQKERYETLFKLRDNHQKYICQKITENGAEKTLMRIKIFSTSFDSDLLKELLSYVEMNWTKDGFALKLDLVKTYSSDAISILPTNKGISYVPDNNNRIVFLSTLNDTPTMKRVLAHEFGHVLGFPDCYIEFFDEDKKELVYYEIGSESTNIMCSLRNNVRVPDDYFSQLSQNSCLFN